MARAMNSFALFDDEETHDIEDVSEVLACVEKKEAEKAAEVARKVAEEAAEEQRRIDEEKRKRDEEKHKNWMKMTMEAAEVEDKERTRRKAAQLAKQQPHEKEKPRRVSRSSNGSVQSLSRPSSGGAESEANDGIVAESTEPSKDAKDDAKKAETKEEKKERLEKERQEASQKARQEQRRIDAAIEAKQMTLKTYEEAVLAEKRKALEDKAKKLEERKVALDEEFETMRLVEKKKEDSLTVKKETEREKKKNKLKQKSDKVQKLSISEFGKLYESKGSQGGANSGRGVANANIRNGANSGRGVSNANIRNGENPRLANGENNGSNQGRRVGNHKEAPRKDGSYKIPTDSGKNENPGRQGGYQRATPDEPVVRSEKSSTKTLPRVEDIKEFPDLLKQ